MAAYAALLSLKHIIEQIQHHPRPPISLDKNLVDSLTENINFLQNFLECYSCGGSSKEAADVLESRIADAAHAAEDIIETRIVDQILGGSTAHGEIISSDEVYQGLEKVIQDIGFIKKDVMDIKEKNIGIEDHLHIKNSPMLGGSASSPSTRQNAVVGLEDLLIEIMDKLTGQQSNLWIIPIVGMGGIGKTTLARNAYVKPLIMHHFDIRAWVTISQNFNVQEILVEILLCIISKDESREILSGKSEGELGERLHKSLWGRRYLIVMDDIWSVEVWDKVQIFFPDNGQGSRIMLTTRLSSVALIGSRGLEMNFLDEDKSWHLLCRDIFEKEEDCPLELKEIGKKIAKNCKGLPLSLVVIGGVLVKSKPTREHWEYISKKLNSIVQLEDNERCLKVLHLSYNQLPAHLKPCFLYMGVFPEDRKIEVSWLVKLWVSEGFLKPIRGKSLEVVAREYLGDLCDRNLLLVHQRGSNGGIKFCKIHDLMRELCLREAEKEKFLYVTRPRDMCINTQRRISIHQSTSEKEDRHALESVSLVRSLTVECQGVLPSFHYVRLLRVLKTIDNQHSYLEKCRREKESLEDVFRLVNSRFLAVKCDHRGEKYIFNSSVKLLWNLQTLIVKYVPLFRRDIDAPTEIWEMTQLRHVQFDGLVLPDPPYYIYDGIVLENLQTLSRIRNFKCGEDVVNRIPNIKKLQIYYIDIYPSSDSCLYNLYRLRKLESFSCSFYSEKGLSRDDLILPYSIKKLTLDGTQLEWEDMKRNIGWLPNLQVLKLHDNSFVGREWETVEGQFCNLRFLQILGSDLECWTTDGTHFPRLEQLVLQLLGSLKEIPSCIGDIPTLGSIELKYCSESTVISAKRVLDEQEELGNFGLRVRATVWSTKHFESLASPNFQLL